ncbi:MAG: hypothetical protein ABF778_03435 [Liquorilactobacillus hordei]|uniref:hypothetical protein n=1 Tax=Liquorilactobacillus hordei TaxID=468911 RepID=UPI0039E79625
MIFLNKKNKIINLLKTVVELIESLSPNSNFIKLAREGKQGIEAVSKVVKDEIPPDTEALKNLQILLDVFSLLSERQLEINDELLSKMKQLAEIIIYELGEVIPVKLNIAFMPYKVTMWDSLASIYEAAKEDKSNVVKVIPIPYYKLAGGKAIPTYEGNLFPKDVPVTSFENYDLEKEEPDIIFIHNAYDQYNTITRVDEYFFTSNLKKYTDMLVYVPYHVTGFFKLGKDEQYVTYSIPTMENIDKIIVAGQFVKEAAVNYGVPEDKVLVMGSPKMDAVYQATKNGKIIPEKWENQLSGKFVFALDTNCMYLPNNPFSGLAYIEQVFDAARMKKNCAVIWRPHPLTRISLAHYIPQLLVEYDKLVKEIKERSEKYPNIIFDESNEYLTFLAASDAYISEPNSLMALYTVTGRPAILASKFPANKNLLPDNAFYHFYDEKFSWYKITDELANGLDRKKKFRINLADKLYVNTDGTSGIKILETIKNTIIDY